MATSAQFRWPPTRGTNWPLTGDHDTRPGRPKASAAQRSETAALRAEVARLQSTIVEQVIELAMLRGKRTGIERADPQPCRWPVKAALLHLVD